MNAGDAKLSRVLPSLAVYGRLLDVRSALNAMINAAAPHDRATIERVAEEVFEAALDILLPDRDGEPGSRRDA
jgi:hypothetical protein